MRVRHGEEAQKAKEKLGKEMKGEEEKELRSLDAEKERQMREIKDKHAAEISARSSAMTPEELQQVMNTNPFSIMTMIDDRFLWNAP